MKLRFIIFTLMCFLLLGCNTVTKQSTKPNIKNTVVKITEAKQAYNNVHKNEILLGIDQIENYKSLFENKRVGLITNSTGINKYGQTTIDILIEHVNLVALFSPEHGIRGNAREGASIRNAIDEKTNLPIYSLYGETKKPTKQMLESIDILCFDIQDVGARFYTYIYTMAYAMEACKTYNKTFIVFDRPNPIGGTVEGNILENEFKSFVGYYPIVQRHGMTVGELAQMFNTEFNINCNLKVIALQNWKRTEVFTDLPLMWIPTSPNIPKPITALVYVGVCLFEGTNVSVGRGTTMPFEYIGAPYMNAQKTCEQLNNKKLPGVFFYPAYFTPTQSIYDGKQCEGVQIIVTNHKNFKPVKTAVTMFQVFKTMYSSNFKINNANLRRCGLNLLMGTDELSKATIDFDGLFKRIETDTEVFIKVRNKYLLYP